MLLLPILSTKRLAHYLHGSFSDCPCAYMPIDDCLTKQAKKGIISLTLHYQVVQCGKENESLLISVQVWKETRTQWGNLNWNLCDRRQWRLERMRLDAHYYSLLVALFCLSEKKWHLQNSIVCTLLSFGCAVINSKESTKSVFGKRIIVWCFLACGLLYN